MSKMLEIIKNCLLIVLILLNRLFYNEYGTSSLHLFYSLLLIILIILTIKDYLNKNVINKNNKYNILMLIIELVMISILLRTLYDTNFMYNVTTSRDSNYLDIVKEINMMYMEQNLYYFIPLILMGLLYRKINMEREERKLHIVTSILLIINITTVIPSLSCLLSFSFTPAIWYLLFTLILIVVETIRLIRDNKIRKDYPIYICFMFNTFALICVFVNFYINCF